MAQKKNKDWYKLTSDGAVFYQNQLVADLKNRVLLNSLQTDWNYRPKKASPELLDKIQKIAEDRRVDTPTIGKSPL